MIRDDLFRDMKDKRVFETVTGNGVGYLEASLNRNVYPEEEALSDLDHFHEKLQDEFVPAGEVISKLEKYGSPATVAQTGGRYFEFVNGGVVPAGLAARLMSDYWDQNAVMQVASPISSADRSSSFP